MSATLERVKSFSSEEQKHAAKRAVSTAREAGEKIDPKPHYDTLIALHAKAFRREELTDGETEELAVALDGLYATGEIGNVEEVWGVLTRASQIREKLKHLDTAREEYRAIAAAKPGTYGQLEFHRVNGAMNELLGDRVQLEDLNRRHPKLVRADRSEFTR